MAGEKFPRVVVHIGMPRTATTSLQYHAFPLLRSALYLCKWNNIGSIHRSGVFNEGGRFASEVNLDQLDRVRLAMVLGEILGLAFRESQGCQSSASSLREALRSVLSATAKSSVFISAERLADNVATLNGASSHGLFKGASDGGEFLIYPLVRALGEIGVSVQIVVVLREPIDYILSKYMRVKGQIRDSAALGYSVPFELLDLSLSSFLANQLSLEIEKRGSSVLAQADHMSLLWSLQRFSFVKAIDFRVLLKSEDVLREFGFNGEPVLRFSSLPKINQGSKHSSEDKKSLRLELEGLLRAYRLWEYLGDRCMTASRDSLS